MDCFLVKQGKQALRLDDIMHDIIEKARNCKKAMEASRTLHGRPFETPFSKNGKLFKGYLVQLRRIRLPINTPPLAENFGEKIAKHNQTLAIFLLKFSFTNPKLTHTQNQEILCSKSPF